MKTCFASMICATALLGVSLGAVHSRASGCAFVLATSDGFVAVRERPNGRMIDKLRGGQIVSA
jgi:hypothetical protein